MSLKRFLFLISALYWFVAIFDLASSGLGIEPVNVQLNLGIALLSLWCLSLGYGVLCPTWCGGELIDLLTVCTKLKSSLTIIANSNTGGKSLLFLTLHSNTDCTTKP